MLLEIVCDKFIKNNSQREPIVFSEGLNIIKGENSGENSIGKSTFLLIIDFVYGGNTYLKQKDVFDKIGHHTIKFCFKFNEDKHFYARSTNNPDIIAICDENYAETGEYLTKKQFATQLKELFSICCGDASAREIIGTHFRIYGKDNLKLNQPFFAHDGDNTGQSIIRILKLFNRFDRLADHNKLIEERKIYKKTIKKADEFKLIRTISTKRDYTKNCQRISELEKDNESLSVYAGKGLFTQNDTDTVNISSIKAEYEMLQKRKRQLWARYYSIKDDQTLKKPATEEDLKKLIEIFPNAYIKHIQDVECFHAELYDSLKAEFIKARNNILSEIDELSKQISECELKISQYDVPQKIATATLHAFANNEKEIEKITKENELYTIMKQIEEEISNNSIKYEEIFSDVSNELEQIINEELVLLNNSIYGHLTDAPQLTFKSSKSYEYDTPSDRGTGTRNKNLILLDLALLRKTSIPAIAHDTILFKHIAQEPINKILNIYNQSNKQIFIAIDESTKYPIEAQKIIEDKTVLFLSNNGEELFGSSWSKRPSLETEINTNE